MVRNIMSNQDVEEILNRTVELIEGAFAEYGVPHVEPVFAEEHVTKLDDKNPAQYQDVLKYNIIYRDAPKLNEKVHLVALAIVINATSDKHATCRIEATTINQRDEESKYICKWRHMCMWSGEEAPDFKQMIDEMLDDRVYEEGGKLPHLLCISKLLDDGFTQQKYFTPPLDK